MDRDVEVLEQANLVAFETDVVEIQHRKIFAKTGFVILADDGAAD